jgi:hypothetical protein
MSKFIKRIQTALSREGIKKTYAEIREELNAIASDPNNPSLDDIKQVKESLSKQSSQITEVREEENQVTETLQQQKNITEEEPMNDESKGEITFNNNFEKAGALQKAFDDNGIVASDVESVTISGRLADTFTSHGAFIVEALQAWRNYRLEEEAKETDKVQSLLADIRTDSVVAQNKVNESINATAAFINDLRAKQREDFMNFIEQVKNG